MGDESALDRLKAWIKRQKFRSQAAAAREIGLHPMVLSQILRKERTPGLANAALIEEFTGIPSKAWVLSAVSRTEDRVSAAADKSNVSKKKR